MFTMAGIGQGVLVTERKAKRWHGIGISFRLVRDEEGSHIGWFILPVLDQQQSCLMMGI